MPISAETETRENHGFFRRLRHYASLALWTREAPKSGLEALFRVCSMASMGLWGLLAVLGNPIGIAGVAIFASLNFSRNHAELKAYRDAHHPAFANPMLAAALRQAEDAQDSSSGARASYGFAEKTPAVPYATLFGLGVVVLSIVHTPVALLLPAMMAALTHVVIAGVRAHEEDEELAEKVQYRYHKAAREAMGRRGVMLAMPKVAMAQDAPKLAVQAKPQQAAVSAQNLALK